MVDQVKHSYNINYHRILLNALLKTLILVERQVNYISKEHIVTIIDKSGPDMLNTNIRYSLTLLRNGGSRFAIGIIINFIIVI
jgi:hypothetical protein